MALEDLHSGRMTREEAKRILRRLELEAYSSIITAFRAQGDISKSKKSILGELSNQLSISTERHRAEVRRVVNDDRLNAVAECMYGSGTSAEWSYEGRRLVSLMPRLVPQTVFTAKATAAANQAQDANQKLPIKSEIEVVPLPTKPKSALKNESVSVEDIVKEEVQDVEVKARRKRRTSCVNKSPPANPLTKIQQPQCQSQQQQPELSQLANPHQPQITQPPSQQHQPQVQEQQRLQQLSQQQQPEQVLHQPQIQQQHHPQQVQPQQPQHQQQPQLQQQPQQQAQQQSQHILPQQQQSPGQVQQQPLQPPQLPRQQPLQSQQQSQVQQNTQQQPFSTEIKMTSSSLPNPMMPKITAVRSMPSFPPIKTCGTLSPSKFSPRPIIVQKSPPKMQPVCSITDISASLTSIANSFSTLNSLVSSKGEASTLVPAPVVKVVSNGLSSTLNPSVSTCANNITQKIKFKTPLPKPKVKAGAKFKPVVPLRSGILCSSQNSNSDGMSVKVVQVGKSGISGSLTSPSLLNYNKPVVVVPSSARTPPSSHKVLSFNSISPATSQTSKSTTFPPSSTSSLPKLPSSKSSMPLATGFKMIAVTTVVPGTTQVKTVYIATPIMSLTKNVSNSCSSVITSPAIVSNNNTNSKHSSITSNLQSVVAKSMNAGFLYQGGKHAAAPNLFRNSQPVSSITTPTFAMGKQTLASSQTKGIRSLPTTQSPSAQGLKLFTGATSKGTPPLCLNSTVRTASFLSTSAAGRVNTSATAIPVNNLEPNSCVSKHEKRQLVNNSNQGTLSNCSSNITGKESTVAAITTSAATAIRSHISSQGTPQITSPPLSSLNTTAVTLQETSRSSATSQQSNVSTVENSMLSSQRTILHLPLQLTTEMQAQFKSQCQSQITSHVQSQIISHIHSQMSSQMTASGMSASDLSKAMTQISPSEAVGYLSTINKASKNDDIAVSDVSTNETVITEQITASAIGENNDSALISAGEKFLEQLSAKICTPLVDVSIKNEKFSVSLDDLGKSHTNNCSSAPDNSTGRDSCTSRLIKQSTNNTSVNHLAVAPKKDNYVLNPRIISRNIDIATCKVTSQVLSSSLCIVPSKGSTNLDVVTTISTETLLNNKNITTNNSTNNVTTNCNSKLGSVTPSCVPVVSMCRSSPQFTSANAELLSLSCSSRETKTELCSMINMNPIVVISTPPKLETVAASFYDAATAATSKCSSSTECTRFLPVNSKIRLTPIQNSNNNNSNRNDNDNDNNNNDDNDSNSNNDPDDDDNGISCRTQVASNCNVFINTEQSTSPVRDAVSNSSNSQKNIDTFTSLGLASTNLVNSNDKVVTIMNVSCSIASPDRDTGYLGDDDTNHSYTSIRRTTSESSTDSVADVQMARLNCSGSGTSGCGKKRKLDEICTSASEFTKSVFETAVSARTQASWIRGAANLLARVARYRGSNKQKGEMNAASWFTKPVDPSDAPGYYRVIRRPMDFGKIKRKLEEGEYLGYPNFYDDMMLIRENCYSYNPSGHSARKDCDEVFSFFETEYEKLRQRWEKHYVSPQKKAKLKPEENGNSS